MSPIEISWLVLAAALFLVLVIFAITVKNLKRKIRVYEVVSGFHHVTRELYVLNLRRLNHQLESVECNDGKWRSRQYHKEAINERI